MQNLSRHFPFQQKIQSKGFLIYSMRQFSAENHLFLLQFKLSNNFTSLVKIGFISVNRNIIIILQIWAKIQNCLSVYCKQSHGKRNSEPQV